MHNFKHQEISLIIFDFYIFYIYKGGILDIFKIYSTQAFNEYN